MTLRGYDAWKTTEPDDGPPQICTACRGPIDDDGECRCEGPQHDEDEDQRWHRELNARLDAHFAKFAPVIKAINAGFAATSKISRPSPPAPSPSVPNPRCRR